MNKFSDFQLLVLEKDHIACQDVEALLGEYFEGDLGSSLTARLSAHIRACRCCKQLENEYCLTIELAREIGAEEQLAPMGVHVRLRQALNRELNLEMPLNPSSGS